MCSKGFSGGLISCEPPFTLTMDSPAFLSSRFESDDEASLDIDVALSDDDGDHDDDDDDDDHQVDGGPEIALPAARQKDVRKKVTEVDPVIFLI